MDKQKRSEIEKTLSWYYKRDYADNWTFFYDLLSNNNYFLSNPRNESFEWAIDSIKNGIQIIKNKNYLTSTDIIIKYNALIDKSVNFLKENIEDNNINRYAFIQSLMYNNSFSLGETNTNEFKDYLGYLGIDVFLGNSCCRHRAELINTLMKPFDDSIFVDVSDQEENEANHRIVSFKNKRKILFLDSTSPVLYYPLDNLRLQDRQNIEYIRSVSTFAMNDKFYDYKDYYSFFLNIYKQSKLTKHEYNKISGKIWLLFMKYSVNTNLQEDFMNTIDSDQKQLKLMCNNQQKIR